MTQEEASKIICAKLEQAETLIRECEKLADEAGVDFSWSGPSYGMGGWFTPKGAEDWDETDSEDYGSPGRGYWMASSRSC